MGKGSWRRPPRVSLKQISDNYDQTFGKKNANKEAKASTEDPPETDGRPEEGCTGQEEVRREERSES